MSSVLQEMVWWDELIDESLSLSSLSDYVLLVVLPERSTQFVVVHFVSIFPLTPESGQFVRIFDLENSCRKVMLILTSMNQNLVLFFTNSNC